MAGNRDLIAEQRKERKQAQNRLNQRNHRARVREQQEANGEIRHCLRVTRWRLGQVSSTTGPSSGPTTSGSKKNSDQQVDRPDGGKILELSANNDSVRRGPLSSGSSSWGFDYKLQLSLSADHLLLHLISQNVCQGFMNNKTLLGITAVFFNAQNSPIHSVIMAPCANAVIRPTQPTMPSCLVPTQLQMNSLHPTWIDMLPFPAMRDNLIKRQDSFRHLDFLADLVGDVVHLNPPGCLKDAELLAPALGGGEETQLGSNSKGLILWGEPHLVESWEATPTFLSRWSWVAEGCEGLIEISNRWRETRGEGPITNGTGMRS
ncbi:hypothetical protein V1506DRAFT_548333 [Lipomyces tetrasporus]